MAEKQDGLDYANNMIIQRGADYKSIYINNVQFQVSTFDMALIFGEIVGEKDNSQVVEEKVKIHMSKEMVKVLTNLLVQNLTVYQRNFGEITIPDFSKPLLPPEIKKQDSKIKKSK